MGASTFELTRNNPLRTVLVDQATSNAKYQIDTPFRLTGKVTKIKKFDQSQQASRASGSRENGEEIATVQWNRFSPDRITFLGKATTREEFLPKCGRLKK